ncbi:MAG: efflux RND transporter permease subunit [Janthinobacterium lividum]
MQLDPAGRRPVNISAPFILRPIATALLAVAVLLAGVMGYKQLAVSSLPQVDFPTIQVTTQLPGANPDTIASLVTASLERQFGQIPSLASMSSQSAFGLSQITLQFNLDRDIDAAAQDVQSAINAANSTLPKNLPYPPTYSKVNPADTPVLTLALTSGSVPLRELSDVADTLLAPKLSQVSGVGHVSVEGNIRPAVRIQADLQRLAAYSISLEDLRAAIVAANVAGSKGSLDGTNQAYTIAANDQIDAAKSYEYVVIAYRNAAPVLLRDVATVIDGLENSRVGGWYAGQPAVIIDVQRQPGANVVETVDHVLQELPRLQKSLSAGVTLKVVHDSTETIRASIRDVEFTLVLSAGLVVLVVLLFLRTVRATIIAGVALPLSIIATFAVMWAAGFSLDNLSLMALTIGTGFVVDDAIVMIENVVRQIEEGMSPLEAALKGAREIGFTIVSLTVSLIAVFIPLLFMTGIVGRMFREFALTLTFAVVVSAVISLTLTPMMCGRLLRAPKRGAREPWLMRAAEAPIAWMAAGYERTLGWALRRQGLMTLVSLLTLGLTVYLYVVIPKGFLPAQDTGLIDVVIEASPTASFGEMSRLQAAASAALADDRDVTGTVAVIGVGTLNPTSNVAHLQLTLKPSDSRKEDAQTVSERVRAKLARIPGITAFVKPVQDIQIATTASRSQYQYTLTGPDGAGVTEWSTKLVDRLKHDPLFDHVAAEVQDGGLRTFVDIDREKAGRLGITAQMIDDTLNDAFGQRQISTIYGQSNQYRVILEAAPGSADDPRILDKLYVGVTSGTTTAQVSTGGVTTAATTTAAAPSAQVPLVSFATLKRTTAPLAVAHQEQFPAAAISFDLAKGASLGQAVDGIAAAERDIDMPTSIIGAFGADAAEFQHSLAGEPWLVLAAVVAIYLVLGILYESFIHPLTILSTLPSAGVGALLALLATGQELSIVALIGIILLMGIVKKNAIMMIDFATAAERDEGLSPFDAIEQACRLRFRPIMMTTLAALFGAIPLALAHGSGAELRVPLGITIIGGLLLSQLLTLYTTPVIYLQMEALGRRFGLGTAPIPDVEAEAAPELRRAAE